ncbi:hypothetical protein N7509_011617 [Penicillium cosmopolitanum]|uniref:Peroxin-22-like protein Pex22-like-Penicillium chrysogenum n=1 Tax=Penicillium cosmopolitanum TaxID=1131564 RepID=A0A9W9SH42_9EURO|nr:uncharacterized protein N7509_011617 [Penicillium cosmopolitanum]KAJ5378498.1 hypothetical protein N7509_011617 [Penicillium cosmopolitanum]
MSFPQDPRRRRGGAGAGFSATGRRTAMGYWIPLALTVGVATLSVAAWIWSERDEDDDEEDDRRPHDGQGPYPPPPPVPSAATSLLHPMPRRAMLEGALRRTPSPQQIFDGASRKVAAGVTAAGAFVGNALTSIREENRGDFEDHSRWSEEAQSRAIGGQQTPTMSGALPNRGPVSGQHPIDKKKKTVVIVSILSHLPEHVDLDTSRIFVLIYAPEVKHAIGQGSSSRATQSIASSYSNIATEEANSSGELPSKDLQALEPRQDDDLESHSPFFKTLYTQAQALVEKENMIMPFSTATGYVHLVRHLAPDLVYVQESLTGNEGEGEAVQHISGWVRQVVVVVGDEGGRGGLIDSDDESALADKGERWWQKDGTTGIGKRIDVVDVLRVGDDWRRRVSGLD